MAVKDNLHTKYDLLIIGGGITGATLFKVCCDSDRKVLLIEKNDFASGTSQASGMMIWGGLLYLKNFEFSLIRKFCKARDYLIDYSDQVFVRRFHFSFSKNGGRSKLFVKLALALYRAFSLGKRDKTESFFNSILPSKWEDRRFSGGLSYEEGFLKESDASFVINWLFGMKMPDVCKAENYAEITMVTWDRSQGHYEVRYKNHLRQEVFCFVTNILNSAGVWVDEVNRKNGIATKYSHHLSKGAYLLLENSNSENKAFVVDMHEHGDTLCWVPWGPVIMWGPTETTIDSISEIEVNRGDVDFLLTKLNKISKKQFSKADIVNVRTGIRPLAKRPGQKVAYSLDLSRKAIIEKEKDQNWYSVFGGKLSGGLEFSLSIYEEIFANVATNVKPAGRVSIPTTSEFFDGLLIPEVEWSVVNTQARCLEDYIRRRTNIAQWIPNGGLGIRFEYESDLLGISLKIHNDIEAASKDLDTYKGIQKKVKEKWMN